MPSRIPIIAYHAIGSCPPDEDRHNLFVPPQAFQSQMNYLAAHKQVVSLDQAVSGHVQGDRPAIAITFDDGYKDFLHRAIPILRGHGFHASVFVPTGWIGMKNGWIEPCSCDLTIMSEEELREAEHLGMRVESHGHAHLDYGAANPAEARKDVDASIEILTKALDRRPRYLAYPYGRNSQEAREVVQEAGIRAAFSIERRHEGVYAWERVQITPLDGPRLFALKASGHYLNWRRSRFVSAAYRPMRPVVRRVLER